MKKKIPTFGSDEEAEHFVATADLSQYDLSGGREVRFSSQPQLWVFAGPNGAGKSTLIRRYRVAELVPVVNADDIAEALRQQLAGKSEAVILALAGRQALEERRRLLSEGVSFAFETTLTGHSELRLMQAARHRGYKVNLVYVRISSAELSNSRVVLRVEAGGHNVPQKDVFRRFKRSLDNLTVALKVSDRFHVLDNSGKHYRLMPEPNPHDAEFLDLIDPVSHEV